MWVLQCSDGRCPCFIFCIHSHVAMWEWSVESPCESGQVVFAYGWIWVRVLLTCVYICVFACVQGDYVLNMKELMSVSLFKIFWHNLKLLRNFFRSVFLSKGQERGRVKNASLWSGKQHLIPLHGFSRLWRSLTSPLLASLFQLFLRHEAPGWCSRGSAVRGVARSAGWAHSPCLGSPLEQQPGPGPFFLPYFWSEGFAFLALLCCWQVFVSCTKYEGFVLKCLSGRFSFTGAYPSSNDGCSF